MEDSASRRVDWQPNGARHAPGEPRGGPAPDFIGAAAEANLEHSIRWKPFAEKFVAVAVEHSQPAALLGQEIQHMDRRVPLADRRSRADPAPDAVFNDGDARAVVVQRDGRSHAAGHERVGRRAKILRQFPEIFYWVRQGGWHWRVG